MPIRKQVLDNSIISQKAEDNDEGYVIHGTKVIDLSMIDVDQLKHEIKVAPYKAVEIDDLKMFIDEALKQMMDKNCTRDRYEITNQVKHSINSSKSRI